MRNSFVIGALAAAVLAGCTSNDGAPANSRGEASAAPPAPAATGLLSGPVYTRVPHKAERLVAGDLNRDGRTDLVVGRGRSTDGNVVLLARPDGGFDATTIRGGGAVMVLADLDADGGLDLAAGAIDGTSVGLHRGLGDGTFAPAIAHPLLGSALVDVAAADSDGDGVLDLTTVFGSADAAVQRGDGQGGFAEPRRSAALGNDVSAATLADLTGDRAADLVLLGYESLGVARNDGTGSLEVGPSIAGRDVGYPPFVRALDLNRDGRTDVAYSSYEGIAIRLGDGTGALDELTVAQLPRSGGYRFVFADLNADGLVDLVSGNGSSNSVTVALGDGAGGFGKRSTTTFDGTVLDVAVADVDGDCAPDVVVGLSEVGPSRIAVLPNTAERPCPARPAPSAVEPGAFPTAPGLSRGVLLGGASFADPVVTTAGGVYAEPALVDVNGDGRHDLVLQGGRKYRFTVRLGGADGTFGPPLHSPAPALTKPVQPPCNDVIVGGVVKGMSASRPSLPMSCAAREDVPTGLALADLDGDGRLDIVTATRNGDSVAVLPGDGTGLFGPQRRFSTGSGSAPSSVLVGDLDGDGNVDVLAAGAGGSIILRGDGRGALRKVRVTKPFGVRALGDLDGDGDLDLVSVGQRYRRTATVTPWLNDGSARFTQGTRLEIPPKSDGSTTFTGVVLRDVDDDGVLDLVGLAPQTREVRVLRGAGDGSFAAPRSFPTGGAEPASVEVGDVTGDGRADLVVVNQNSGEFAVLAADGSGGFAAAVSYRSGGPVPFAVFLADVDGDDALDVVIFHGDPRVVAVHRGVRSSTRP